MRKKEKAQLNTESEKKNIIVDQIKKRIEYCQEFYVKTLESTNKISF